MTTHNIREEEIPKFFAGGKALAKDEVVVTYKDHLQELQKAREEGYKEGHADALRTLPIYVTNNHSELDQDNK